MIHPVTKWMGKVSFAYYSNLIIKDSSKFFGILLNLSTYNLSNQYIHVRFKTAIGYKRGKAGENIKVAQSIAII